MGSIALGCNILEISRLTSLNNIINRITLIEPAVEPALPPINIMINKIILLKSGHKPKSVVEYPVVVIMDDT